MSDDRKEEYAMIKCKNTGEDGNHAIEVGTTTEEAVFSIDPTEAPIDWLDSDHVICVYCRFMSVPQLYKQE
jgi:hypothetical protein